MHWIYISPHLDDAVYSCGGLIRQQVDSGDRVEIWTLCAGDPPDEQFSPFAEELHARWNAAGDAQGVANAVDIRRKEDHEACRIVGAEARHLPLPDCIYRRPGLEYWWKASSGAPLPPGGIPAYFYPNFEAIFAPLNALEMPLVEQSATYLSGLLPPETQLVLPLTLGGHVDHQLARRIGERLSPTPWYYADYPYAAEHLDEADSLAPSGWRKRAYPLSAAELEAWAQSIDAHRSQMSTFWPGADEMRLALQAHSRRLGGAALWSSEEPL